MRVEKKPSTVKPSQAPAENRQNTSFRDALQRNREQQARKLGDAAEDADSAQGEPLSDSAAESSAGVLESSAKERGERALREKSRQQDTGQPLASAFASFAGQNQNPVIEEAAEAAAGAPIESIQRVADEVVVLCAGGAQEVQIEVDSKVLQDLRIAVRQKDGEVSVRLMTDSSHTMQALQAGLPQLMAALQARNVVVAAIDVTPRFASTGSAFSRGQRQGQSGRDRQGGRGRR